MDVMHPDKKWPIVVFTLLMPFLFIVHLFSLFLVLCRAGDLQLSFHVLVSEASVALSDDITSPSGSVELLRLTLTKLLVELSPPPPQGQDQQASPGSDSRALAPDGVLLVGLHCAGLQVDNQLYNRASFHFPVLLCQEQRSEAEAGGPWSAEANPATAAPEALEEFKRSCFLELGALLAADCCTLEQVGVRCVTRSLR